jgi:hypothetical protein
MRVPERPISSFPRPDCRFAGGHGFESIYGDDWKPWVSNKIQWTQKFRTIMAMRGDYGKGIIASFTNPTNPGYPNDPYPGTFSPNTAQSIRKFLPSPKASASQATREAHKR